MTPATALPEAAPRRLLSGRLPLAGAALAAAALLGVLYAGLGARSAADGAVGVNSAGAAVAVRPKPAPDFVLTTFDGRPFRLSDQRGSLVVVNFWGSWCVPCREEAAALERGWQAGRDRGVVFVGVNLWDRAPAARDFVARHGVTYPTGLDAAGETAIAFGVRGLPETFFIDRSGEIAAHVPGPLYGRLLHRDLEKILNG
jgi:cytochrome c biogenesis protein CcmG/thiol:disulfide interchange protein DsbE